MNNQVRELTSDIVAKMQEPFEPQEHGFVNGRPYVRKNALRKRLTLIDPRWIITDFNELPRREGVVVLSGTLYLNSFGIARTAIGIGKAVVTNKDGEKVVPFEEASTNARAYKTAASDLIPRCCMEFEIGTYLKDAPKNIIDEKSLTTWLATLKSSSSQITTTEKTTINPKIEEQWNDNQKLFDNRADFDKNFIAWVKSGALLSTDTKEATTEKIRRLRWPRDMQFMNGFKRLLSDANVSEDEFWSFVKSTPQTYAEDTATAKQRLSELVALKTPIDPPIPYDWAELNKLGDTGGIGNNEVFTMLAGAAGISAANQKLAKIEEVESVIPFDKAKEIINLAIETKSKKKK